MYDKQELIKMVQRVIDCEEDEDTIDQLLEIWLFADFSG